MGQITLDDALRARLNGLTERIELRDEAGALVGVFLPADHYRALLRDMEIPLSAEEIERRKQEQGGSSLEDIWKRLGAK